MGATGTTTARRLLTLILLGALALVGSGPVRSVTSESAAVAAEPEPASRLFVENASSGSLSSAADGTMTLRLVGVLATVWFTDRPVRKSGVEDTATFVKGWSGDGTFAKQPPNGVLEGRVQGVRRVLPVELTTARYTPETATVEYTVKALPQAPGFYKGSSTAKLGTGSFGSSSLFIDDAVPQAGCWVQWTIPNIVNSGVNTWAGLQIDSGGTFSYSWGREIDAAGGSLLFSYVGPGGTINAAGPEQWFVQPRQTYFEGAGIAGGTVQFITWFDPEPGSQSVTGSVFGAGSTPVADAPAAFRGTCSKVTVSSQAPYVFTVNFGSNT